MSTVSIILEVPTVQLLTSNQRLHWAVKAERTKLIRHRAYIAARDAITPMEAAHLTVGITWPDRRERDAHNIIPTLKAAIDGIVQAGLLPDDSDRYLTGPDLRVMSGVTGHRFVSLALVFAPRQPTPA